MAKNYLNTNVLEEAKKRISFIFDNFEEVTVSISSGKDSTVLFYLALNEARKRKRDIKAFFLDQEAEYQNSIDIINFQMNLENVIPLWFQIPIYLTNATSNKDFFLYAWGEGEKWIRNKNDISIKEINEDYPKRFYEFFDWYQNNNSKSAYLVGIRADESLNRYRAVTKNPGWNDIKWSTKVNNFYKFYPIYDWGVFDIWKYIYDNNIKYNKIYDLMYMKNYSVYKEMRVSNLIHEKSYKCLIDLPKFEPETYNKLCKRISGISTASRYASEKLIFSNKTLPKHYKKWEYFRDFLLENIENQDIKNTFIKRFESQDKTEKIFQAQVGQLLILDYENSRPFDTKLVEKKEKVKDKWRSIL